MPTQRTDALESVRPFPKSAATRLRIMNAAASILAKQGYAGLRLSAVAEEAGLQTGSLYYHFQSKEQLVEEVLDWGVRVVYDHVRDRAEALGPRATAIDRITAAIDGFLSSLLEIGELSPAHLRNYQDLPEDIRVRLRPGVLRASRYWGDLVRAGIEEGSVRDDVDPFYLQLFVIHTMEQVSFWPPHPRGQSNDVAATVRRLIVDGIRTHRP